MSSMAPTTAAPIQPGEPIPAEQAYRWSFPGSARTFEFRYHAASLPVLVLVARLVFGFFFFMSGLSKVIQNGTWMGFEWWKGAASGNPGQLIGFLSRARGPFEGLWSSVAQNPTALDILSVLVPLSEVLVGLGMMLGLLTRLSLFGAGLMMALFYTVNMWPRGVPIVNSYVFFVVYFSVLGALGAGRIFGIDAILEAREFVRRRPWLRWILG